MTVFAHAPWTGWASLALALLLLALSIALVILSKRGAQIAADVLKAQQTIHDEVGDLLRNGTVLAPGDSLTVTHDGPEDAAPIRVSLIQRDYTQPWKPPSQARAEADAAHQAEWDKEHSASAEWTPPGAP